MFTLPKLNYAYDALEPFVDALTMEIHHSKHHQTYITNFNADFTQSAIGQFGSGWAWLVYDENNKLKIYSLPNQDSPLTIGHKPMFCLDVWEHAYYLKYQNRRADYVNNWWNVLKLI